MSKDVECPYCGKDHEINHDDGYGYDEDVTYEQECDDCGKSFAFKTSILFLYSAEKADCMNGGSHLFKPTHSFPMRYTRMCCTACDSYRDLTDQEWFDLIPLVECI